MGIGIFNELELEIKPVQSEDETYGARLIAGHIIGTFPLLHAYFGNERTYGRLVGAVQAHMQAGASSAPRAFALSQTPAALEGFEFRAEAHLRLKGLRRHLKVALAKDGRSVEVQCRLFQPKEVLDLPLSATHVSFVWVLGSLPDYAWSPKQRAYRPLSRETGGRELFQPMPPQKIEAAFPASGLQRIALPASLPRTPRNSLLVGLGVVYFRQIDTQLYALPTHNNCVVLKVL